MPLFSPIIETIVGTIAEGVYLRATSPEANIELDDLDLKDKIVVVYNNLPELTSTVGQSGYVEQLWPVEIQVLKLADFDDNDVNGDLIRTECLRIANFIFDSLPRSGVSYVETYDVSFLEQVKLYDKTLTGCNLTFEYPIERTVYCDDLNP